MINYISTLGFVILLLVGGAVVAPLMTIHPVLAVVVGIVWLIADVVTSSATQLAAQWHRAVVFRLGKFSKAVKIGDQEPIYALLRSC